MSDEPTWRRPLGAEEQTILLQRYEQLAEVWRARWPDDPLPEITGDALQQTRVVQMMAHRIRDEGLPRPEGGLRRGPGMHVEDAVLRRVREQQERLHDAPAASANGEDPDADP